MFVYAKDASAVGFACPDLTQDNICSEELEDTKFVWLEQSLAPHRPPSPLEDDERPWNGRVDAQLIGSRPVLKPELQQRRWRGKPFGSKTITASDFEYNGRGPWCGNWGNKDRS